MKTNPILSQYKKKFGLSDTDIVKAKDFKSIILNDGRLFAGYDEFKDALEANKDKVITIHPDYDVDGVMGGITAKIGLDAFGYKSVNLFYPKSTNGYGLTEKAVDDLLSEYPDTEVILTVDNGINTKPGTDYAFTKGVSVIVTDHHKAVPEMFPDKALAAVNPNRVDQPETYPFKDLSGTGVVWKLLQGMAVDLYPEQQELIETLNIFTGISIVSDVMPQVKENRRILRETLDRLSKPNWLFIEASKPDRPASYMKAMLGMKNLLEILKLYRVTAKDIGFAISPTLNSPRRMTDSSKAAFEVFTRFNGEAKLAAKVVVELNEQRKLEQGIAKEKFDKFAKITDYSDKAGIVYKDDNMKSGVAGLMSTYITNEFKVPSIALCHDFHGSGRAPLNSNVHEILKLLNDDFPEMFNSWGGHKSAVGVSVNPDYYDLFVEKFDEYARKVQETTANFERQESPNAIKIDVLNPPSLSDVKEALIEFDKMAPFSEEVPEPKFAICFTDEDPYAESIMKTKHVKFTFKGIEVIAWNQAEKIKHLEIDERTVEFTLLGFLGINEYNGKSTIQVTSQFLGVNVLDKE